MPWHLSEVKDFYKSYAAKYDSDTSVQEYPSPDILSRWVREYCNRTPGRHSILDLGVGTGKSSALFFQEEGYDVVGVDGSEEVD